MWVGEVGPLRAVVWEGDSRSVIRSFPGDVKDRMGDDLFRVQQGKEPLRFRPMRSVGMGVFELKDADERGWYRVMYYTQVKGRIYVLHAFEKTTRKTSHRDLNLARNRLKRVKERLRKGLI
ncbi:MAG: type II toxin-antitoxin system RelE/ParE family toxin [Pseudomonadota bacterium]